MHAGNSVHWQLNRVHTLLNLKESLFQGSWLRACAFSIVFKYFDHCKLEPDVNFI